MMKIDMVNTGLLAVKTEGEVNGVYTLHHSNSAKNVHKSLAIGS